MIVALFQQKLRRYIQQGRAVSARETARELVHIMFIRFPELREALKNIAA